jgi:molybdopterin/thiamine biosynthesis adenylyltransferase
VNDRYQRHNLIDWFDQRRLRDAHIVVVGAGAVGNEVLKNLALLGVGHIHVFDFDRIEAHNLTRCVLFRDSDVGALKAEVAAAVCRQIDPNTEVRASCADVWDQLSLGELEESDAVVCCVDNYEARVRLNQLCLRTSTDFYNTGIDSRYASAEVFPFSSSPEGACYECALPPSAYATIQKRFSCGWLRKVALEEKKIPSTAITSSIAGATIVSLLLNRLCNHPQAIQQATRCLVDTITLSSTTSVFEHNPDCLVCASIDPSALRTVARRYCNGSSVIPLIGNVSSDILLSEPVLIRGTCKLCNREQEYYESTNRVSDAVTFCTACGAQSVTAEIVDRLSVEQFGTVFAGHNVPCKYLVYNSGTRQFIVELED